MISEIKPLLKIQFTDFWPDFIPEKSFFYKRLSLKFRLELSDKPDILFYSVYTKNHQKYNCTKVLFTGENVRPDFNECDFAFSFDYPITAKNYRLPLYALYQDADTLTNRKQDFDTIFANKTKFCCFIVSNPDCETRNNFYLALSKLKHVDSAGKLFNNTGVELINKIDYIKDYKFVIAFENSSYPGYVTEKIYEPFISNCIPIYWGSDLVTKDFNSKRFVNCHDFKNFDEAIEFIKDLDNNDDAYLSMLKEPIFELDVVNEFVDETKIMKRLEEIVYFTQHKSVSNWLKALNRMCKYYLNAIFWRLNIKKN